MSDNSSPLSKARVYLAAAREKEDIDNVNASINYLKAAREFNEALKKCGDPDLAITLESRVDYCKTQADRLKPNEDNILKQGGEEGLRNDFSSEIPKINYDNVAGMENLKKELSNKLMLPIKHHSVYEEFINKTNNGVILYGPPGCGKTFISKATVGELNKRLNGKLTYISVKISDILSQYVGVSEKNLDNVFKQAAEESPSVLFFDEIDALGGSRSGSNTQSHDRKLVNQFLSSFERIEDKLVLVVGATNYPWGVDSALMRSGRFSNVIRIDPPDLEARKGIFTLSLKNKRLGENFDLEKLAGYTKYMSCSDIVHVCDKAGEFALSELEYNPDRKIEYVDLLNSIKNQESSLYKWCEDALGPIKRGEIHKTFSDLENLVNEIDSYRINQYKKERAALY